MQEVRLSPDRNSPEDCSCLAKGRAAGSARPARHEQKTKFQQRLCLVSRRCGELLAACEESAAIIIGVTARRVVTRGVMVQKSAAAMVVFRCFTRVADHEGPNMRSRTQQWPARAARYSTMNPDWVGESRAAQAQDAGLVRILCVAREGVYETLHEPPTADPHGGWCGGLGVKNSRLPD